MVTRARSGCGANKKILWRTANSDDFDLRRAEDLQARVDRRFRSALGQVFFCGDHCVSRRERSLIC